MAILEALSLLGIGCNSSRIQDQSSIWFELTGIASLNLPWILIGDFNAIASLNEFQGGSRNYYRSKARVFSDFIFLNNVLDVNYISSRFTWCNNQVGAARKWACLDRCLLNPRCMISVHVIVIRSVIILQ
ncbi:DNase I-like protein [Dioscorea alata]|uniref:DNase I-like protein n=1 Tax=Dioscorea alata TaxID=55571 RepID=A0ACB7UHP6_DIOAL|nr:DNase I-like protein [Dioscorea alata]